MYVLIVNRLRQRIDYGELSEVIPRHITWLRERIDHGSVLQAGKWGDIGGMCVLRAESIDEAERFVQDDPLVRSGLVTYEVDEFFPMKEVS